MLLRVAVLGIFPRESTNFIFSRRLVDKRMSFLSLSMQNILAMRYLFRESAFLTGPALFILKTVYVCSLIFEVKQPYTKNIPCRLI